MKSNDSGKQSLILDRRIKIRASNIQGYAMLHNHSDNPNIKWRLLLDKFWVF